VSRIDKLMAIAGALLCIAGAAMLASSAKLTPYISEELFEQRSAQVAYGDSAAFHALREAMLSPKYDLHDYGWCLIAAGVAGMLVSFLKKGPLMSPRKPWMLAAIAVAVPVLSTAASRFGLMQAADRGKYPTWADSLTISMMALPFVFAFILIWHLAHLYFLVASPYQAAPLARGVSLRANWWLLAVCAVTLFTGLLEAAHGQYWNAIPSFLSAYFMLSITAASRKNAD
jgi:hypothetical protein